MSLAGFTRIGTYTLPTLAGSHTEFVAVLKWADFAADVLTSLDDGGGDLRFSIDEAGASQLACEVVTLDKVGNEAEVYVGPFSAATGTVIHIWGANAGASQPAVGAAFGRNAVWANTHLMARLNSTVAEDFSPNSLNFSSNATFGVRASFPFGDGSSIDFDGGSNSFFLSNDSFTISGDFTLSLYAFLDSYSDRGMIGSTYSAGTDAQRFGLRADTVGFLTGVARTVKFAVNADINSAYQFEADATDTLKTGEWTKLIMTRTGTTLNFYSSNFGTTPLATETIDGSDVVIPQLYIGRGLKEDSSYDGSLRNIKIQNSSYDVDWIADEHANQSAVGAWGTMAAVVMVLDGAFWAGGFWASGFWADEFWAGISEVEYQNAGYRRTMVSDDIIRPLLTPVIMPPITDTD